MGQQTAGSKAGSDTSQASRRVIDLLNRQVANCNVLYVKLHDYHWNVKGPNFYTLHAKFEELYDEVTLFMDEVAERVLALGGKPLSTMISYLAETTLSEAKGDEDAEAMVRSLIQDLSQVAAELKETAKIADEAGDLPTHDMLVGKQEQLEKHVWMLEAFLAS
ncbi:general stress protein [Paenibacillus sp. 32O-W]|uniref:Dps family protein n=1 Tax=Paenibacillus sp. 32O-W TaxID=1695218 RepID=UPI0007222CEA|nr:Dps family protein [Paenibacillus sp. 32O-W]ALS26040.1 general stress protein [Paenibacillus sp. 32O-W]